MRRTLTLTGLALVAVGGVILLRPSTPIAPLTPEPTRAGEGTCPAGADDSGLGPDMVRLPEGFCIDKTEVTRGQYEAWLDSKPSTAGQPSACASNSDYTPSCAWKPGSDQQMPVVCVDWCDARAFCEAAGKRLCGKVGDGGPYAFESYEDPATSEWFAACTSGGKYDYTYGSTLDTSVCRDADADDYTQWGLGDVGTFLTATRRTPHTQGLRPSAVTSPSEIRAARVTTHGRRAAFAVAAFQHHAHTACVATWERPSSGRAPARSKPSGSAAAPTSPPFGSARRGAADTPHHVG
ncbi:MAG: SUMF1/EgtB/PvdO family nonheme iron enzyme [Polyangiaceae bacterium]